ncbi:hypothetical protein A2U01_0094075, partial [Trifolium medium]|nr:hypothetical protein [Trifolium medium]
MLNEAEAAGKNARAECARLDSKVATKVLFLERGTSINPFENKNK